MRIFYFENVFSTNDDAIRLLNGGMMPPFGVIAKGQTNGRGCHGKKWIGQDPGNIYFSAALPVEIFSANSLPMFTQTFVLSLLEKLEKIIHLNVKWPNDILFAGKKVGGVLVETCFSGKILRHAVLGVGINVASAPNLRDVPGATYEATALKIHLPSISRSFVLDNVIQAVIDTIDLHKHNVYAEFVANNWKIFDAFCHRQINVELNKTVFSGESLGLDACGRLVLRVNTKNNLSFDSANAKIIL
jgi:BirA family biotin operon repressor/biotin-[acetyl-CoA-carboxylase] ligase